VLIVNVHVDDNYIVGEDAEVADIIAKFKTEFKIKELGDPNSYLGIECIVDDEGDVQLSQKRYIGELYKRFKGEPTHKSNPYIPHASKRLEKITESEERTTLPYNQAVGGLVYLAKGTRPEISYNLMELSRQLQNPSDKHFHAAMRVIEFLNSTDVTLPIKANTDAPLIELWVDSDHVGDTSDDCTSVGGWYIKVAGVTVAWGSKVAHSTAITTTDAEIIALEQALRKCLSISKLLVELGVVDENDMSIIVHEDNHGAVKALNNELGTPRLKHLRIKLKWLREAIERGTIILEHIPGKDNAADVFTKPLPNSSFYKCWEQINKNVKQLRESTSSDDV
jgi:hypothetical protein